MKPMNLFISYSHKDEAFREELVRHLAPLKRIGRVAEWHDRMIPAGSQWANQIDQHLSRADMAILLVSSDFLASNYCYEKEFAAALEQHRQNKTIIVPVIIRACLWDQTPIQQLQALPRDAKPVAEWQFRDQAWSEVARGILTATEGVYQAAEARSRYKSTGLARTHSGISGRPEENREDTVDITAEWEDLRRLRLSAPSLALAIALYRKDQAAFEANKDRSYERIMDQVNSRLPVEVVLVSFMVRSSERQEAKVKLKTQLLQILTQLEIAQQDSRLTSALPLLNARTLNLSPESVETCQQELTQAMSEYAAGLKIVASTLSQIQEAILAPIRRIRE